MAFVSVLTAAHNEAGNIEVFLKKVVKCFREHAIEGEIVCINDGSTDKTGEWLEIYESRYDFIRVISNDKREGLTAFLNSGFKAVRGDIIILMPTDLESDPEEDIPKLLNELYKGFDIVTACRQNRDDGKVISSKIYNYACNKLFHVSVHDMNWIKALKRETISGLKLHSDWHRYLIPILAVRGYTIGEVKTNWYPRQYGRSKFGFKRIFISFFDFIALTIILKLRVKPL
jgi:glycosyltransferase involved in cell wall biosynthesis